MAGDKTDGQLINGIVSVVARIVMQGKVWFFVGVMAVMIVTVRVIA